VPSHNMFKKLLSSLSVAKNLLFAMLLRPVKPANRSFATLKDDKKFTDFNLSVLAFLL
jgi:hypothetical protein